MIKGYLIGDIFISENNIKYFNIDSDISRFEVTGVGYGRHLKIENIIKKELFSYLTYANLEYNCGRLNKIGITLSDINFIRCSFNDIANSVESEIWSILDDLTRLYYYVCIDSHGSVLGFLAFRENLYYYDNLYLSMFETVVKNKGVGTSIINKLKVLGKTLRGTSIVSAKQFWGRFTNFNDSYSFVI